MIRASRTLFIILLVPILLSACGAATDATPTAAPAGPLVLTSTSFEDGGQLDPRYKYSMASGQCSGENISPQLAWTGGPAETRSWTVISIDLDDSSNWVHWVQFNIPPEVRELPEAVGGPDIGLKGRNYFYAPGYGGPCPPGGAHRYGFTVYALDALLPLESNAFADRVIAALEGHVLEQATIVAASSR